MRRDHFYIQTAKDSTGPYFSYRHSECSYNFDPDRWYTMTVEFIDDHLIAHIDRDHIAYANHPIINNPEIHEWEDASGKYTDKLKERQKDKR